MYKIFTSDESKSMQVKTHINICDFRAGDFELTGTEAIQMDLSFPNNVNCAKKRGGGGAASQV